MVADILNHISSMAQCIHFGEKVEKSALGIKVVRQTLTFNVHLEREKTVYTYHQNTELYLG